MNLPAIAPISPGAKGDPGTPGAPGPPANFRGNWQTSTSYALGDAVTFTDGNSYISTAGSNTATPPASPWTLWTTGPNVVLNGKTATRAYSNWPSTVAPYAAEGTVCTDTYVPDFAAFGLNQDGYTPRWCKAEAFSVFTPGFMFGNVQSSPGTAGFPQGGQLHLYRHFAGTIAGAGTAGDNVIWNKLGPGDFNLDTEVNVASGMPDSSAEGIELHRNVVTQLQTAYGGTITTATAPSGPGTPATSIGPAVVTLNCTSLCPNADGPGGQGTQRYLIEPTPVASTYASAITAPSGYTPGVFTLPTPLTGISTSTAHGVLTSPCIVNQTAASLGSSCTFTVSVTSGAFVNFGRVAVSGTFHNESWISSATTGGGVATITMNAHHSIPVGAHIYQGETQGSTATSCTGLAVELVANTVNGLKLPFDVVGCPDASHLAVVQYITGGVQLDLGNVYTHESVVYQPITSDGAGTVSIPISLGDGLPLVGQTVTITGSAHFSGSCTNARLVGQGPTLQCTSTSTGPNDSVGTVGDAHVSVWLGTNGFGNTAINLYRMAEVLDVRNPVTGLEDNTLVLEANQLHASTGTAVEETQLPAQAFALANEAMTATNPYFSNLSSVRHVTVTDAYGDGGRAPNSYAFDRYFNATPLSRYAGTGGTRWAPVVANLHGLFAYGREFQYAPQIGLDDVHCPATSLGCADTAASWTPFTYAGYPEGSGGGITATWTPSTDNLQWQINGPSGYNQIEFSPNGIYTQKPIEVGALGQGYPNQFAGTCSMSSGTTCTVALSTVYQSQPAICFVQTQGANVSAGSPACSVATVGTQTVVTVTSPNANSNTFGVMLVGNPQ